MEYKDSLKLALYFSCYNLKDEDQLTKSDPIIKVYKIQSNSSEFIGKTEVVQNNLNPVFKTKIDVLYEPLLKQDLKIVVFDHDTKEELDHLGSVIISIEELLKNSKHQVYKADLKTITKKQAGGIYINFDKEEINKESAKITWQWSISNLINVDFGLWDKTDSILEFYRFLDENVWFPIYETECIKNDLNPAFSPFQITMERLCGNNRFLPIKVHCRDVDNFGTGKFIGYFTFTMNNVLSGGIDTFELRNELLEKKSGNNCLGTVKVSIKNKK